MLTPHPEKMLEFLYGKKGRLSYGGSQYMAYCVNRIARLMLKPKANNRIGIWKGIIRFLLKRKVSSEAALNECCMLHNSDVLKVLVESGVSPTRALKHWSRSLTLFCSLVPEKFPPSLRKKKYGYIKNVPNDTPEKNQTRILHAIKADYRNTIYWLTGKGAIPADDAIRNLPIDEPDLFDLFLTITPNVEAANRMFQLYLPESHLYPQELFRVLLKHGADPNQPATRGECKGFRPIMIVLNTDRFALMEQLLVAGADVGKV
ncbi:MAG: hypothetical protein GXO70_10560, partial [Acidobacteria bacterium]|nr:hypothetical protein [Acidobacteriota bacterium]